MRLVYYRTHVYRTHVRHKFLGLLFGLHDGNVGRNMNPLGTPLAGIFRIPERRVDLGPDEVRELFFDATEQPVNRRGIRSTPVTSFIQAWLDRASTSRRLRTIGLPLDGAQGARPA